MIVMEIGGLAFLAVASYFDFQKREIPYAVSLGMVGYGLIFCVIFKTFSNILTAAVIFLILFLMCRFSGLGGADAILGAASGLIIGMNASWALFLAFLFSLPRAYLSTRDKVEYPFVPYILFGYLIVMVWTILH